MLDEIKRNIEEQIKACLSIPVVLEKGKIEGAGDFAFPVFHVAKESGGNPADIALQIAAKLSSIKIKFVKEVKAIGPYVNIWLDWNVLGKKLMADINEKYGKKKRCRKNVVIDYCSPNPAHPLHIGTLRSTLIGESLSRIFSWCGFDVKRICYINDLGWQAAVLLFGYKKFGRGARPKGKEDVWLGNIYMKTNAELEHNKALEKQVSEILQAYENNDRKTRALGKKVFGWCIDGFKKTWDVLGIKFDDIIYENRFVEDGRKITQELKRKGLLFESEGALILRLEPELPNTVFIRSDGTGLYMTRDLPFTIYKYKKWKPYRNIYVVGEDQKMHFRQMFNVLKRMGYEQIANSSVHVAYSMVSLEGKKMSARRGTMVLWDDLYEQCRKKAFDEVKRRWPALTQKEARSRGDAIALATIKYYILKYAPEKPVNFVMDIAMRFEGDTGPYLQYTYARASSILSKGKKIKRHSPLLLKEKEEIELMKCLAEFPDACELCCQQYSPHYLCTYLYMLADSFNRFYERIPVLKAEEKERASRLRLVAAVRTVLGIGMNLLGIDRIEKM